MKKLLVYTIALSFLLTACGGGGGGGGGGARPEPAAAINAAEYAIFSAPPANVTGTTIERDGNANDPNDDYVLIQRDADGIKFTYRDVSNNKLLGNSLSMRSFHVDTGTGASGHSDFVTAGNYLKAQKSETLNLNHTTSAGLVRGTFTSTDILEVGGKKLGLSYADFGMWKTKTEFHGTVNGVAVNQVLMHEPEDFTGKMSGTNNRAYFPVGGSGTASFSGNAIGVVRAHKGGDDVAAPQGAEIYGQANLNVDLANRRASLDLNFANFYNFRFNGLEVERDGEFEDMDSSTMLISGGAANTTGINMNKSGSASFEVDGKFYGPTRTDPSEAVGDAEIKQYTPNGDNRVVEVDIAFGVKR